MHRDPEHQPFIAFCVVTITRALYFFSAEKHLSQEPGIQPYNISEDSVPEHKVALLKA